MAKSFQTISPVDGSIYIERPYADANEIDSVLGQAVAAQKSWQGWPLADRQAILSRAIDALVADKDRIALQLTWQMGRPISQTPGEVGGLEERARHMIAIAPQALADIVPDQLPGFSRFIRRVPLGVVAILAPWNFPYLTAVNGIVPALAAGNAVVLKHSRQTPLCAERFADAFAAAGLPADVFQYVNLDHDQTASFVADGRINYVNFTGSVMGGHAIQEAVSRKFITTGLELGGKDPAYVRADADLDHAIENVVDGAFFNSGQSCCGIERIYVHKTLYSDFVTGAVELVSKYVLGDPTLPATNLGPMVNTKAANFVRAQIADAVDQGATALIDASTFPADKPDTSYLAPQVLVDVDHTMRVMTEESFGPVVGIMPVDSDEQAVALMNDSDFGLTASIWTQDEQAALDLADQLETGTVFMNRCDYLDPALVWTGVKNSGRGCTLSSMGYEALTRPKSIHLRTKI
jgi:acyl-CoA reductase-like NAD-dependent aldehyde dehydrogenase